MRSLVVFSLFLTLVGCGSGGGGSAPGENGGGGSGQGSVPPAQSDCLAKSPALSVKAFSGASDAVEAFARAAVSCGASLPALERQAEQMQNNGVAIGGAR